MGLTTFKGDLMKHMLITLVATLGLNAHAELGTSNLEFVEHLPRFLTLSQPSQTQVRQDACDMAAARSACTNMSVSYTFNGCSIKDGAATLLGGWDESYAGTGADVCALPMSDGGVITRTSKGLTITAKTGESMSVDTIAGTAWDGTRISDKGVEVKQEANVQTVTVYGAHGIAKDNSGNVAKEVYAMSSTPVAISGAQKDGSLVIAGGAIRVFDQIEKYNSDITVDKVAFSDKACCHAVSGTITEVRSGAKTGTRTAAFTDKCGVVNLTDENGSVSEVTLPACN